MIFNRRRAQPAKHTIAVLGQATQIAIELLIPVREFALLGQVFNLVDVAGSVAATVCFLQSDQIEVAQQVANFVQITGPPFVWQHVLPAAGQVVAVTLGAVTDLDIEAEQTQTSIIRQPACRQMIFVNLRFMQANNSLAFPAPHGGGRRLLRRLGCTLFGDQLVGHVQGLLRATGSAEVEAIFAVDDHGWNARNFVFLGKLFSFYDLALDGE